MGFTQRLAAAWSTSSSLLCVGLDPDPTRFPSHVGGRDDAIEYFCRSIIDATGDLVCAFKPQIAYFAAHRAEAALERICEHVRNSHPSVVLILDAKRGDIGDTAEMYAREAFDRYGADAVTVNPFLGSESLEPFLSREDRGTFVLCRTSNVSAHELQSLRVGDTNTDELGKAGIGDDASAATLSHLIARRAATEWSARRNIGLVVGATAPEELREIRAIVGELPLLVPGVGAQGGDPMAVVANGATANGTGLVVNSSRGVLYASSGDDYANAARLVALDLRDTLNRARGDLSRRS